MANPWRILHLEDVDADAELIYQRLIRACPQVLVIRAENEEQFVAALEAGGFDLILSDSQLPRFDGLTALRLAAARRPEIPFVFVSGEMDAEFPMAAIKQGAVDFVQKNSLKQLVPSIQKALAETGDGARGKPAES